MNNLISNIQIQVNENVFLKDPNSSDLGKKIIGHSIVMIDEIGFEGFTFRKLARDLNSTESSVYRYFENKFKLLIYITTWYWNFIEYQLVFTISNIQSPEDRLKKCITVLSGNQVGLAQLGMIDLHALNRIVISESPKVYLNKLVDEANKVGLYAGYKQVIQRISGLVTEINPTFAYPHSLVSTLVEGIHQQKYFADHLPSLTDIRNDEEKLIEFFTNMAFAMIKKHV